MREERERERKERAKEQKKEKKKEREREREERKREQKSERLFLNGCSTVVLRLFLYVGCITCPAITVERE